jgi:hypothetical protein
LCSGVVTASSVTGSGASVASTLTSGTSYSFSGCLVTAADNVGTNATRHVADDELAKGGRYRGAALAEEQRD